MDVKTFWFGYWRKYNHETITLFTRRLFQRVKSARGFTLVILAAVKRAVQVRVHEPTGFYLFLFIVINSVLRMLKVYLRRLVKLMKQKTTVIVRVLLRVILTFLVTIFSLSITMGFRDRIGIF